MSEQEIQLDHIVLLLPYHDVVDPPSWITDHFSISPGGTHADGKTANKLILFKDGTYLELIAFIDDDSDRRKGHFWDKEYGIVDFALTTPGRLDYDALSSRLSTAKSSIKYGAPQGGGRKTPAGVDLKWEITSAVGIGRGYVPFFCNDVTDRDLRVDPNGRLEHPCGATGIAHVVIDAKEQVDGLALAIAAITNDQSSDRHSSHVSVPRTDAAFKKPSINVTRAEDSRVDLKIDLVIATNGKGPSPIERQVGNGHVSISFV